MGHRICRRDNIRIGGIGYDGTVPVISVSAAEQLKDVQEHVHEVEVQVQGAQGWEIFLTISGPWASYSVSSARVDCAS